MTAELVAAWELEEQAKGITPVPDSQPDDEPSAGRRFGQGGLRGDASTSEGEERYKVISFGGKGNAREEAFVASLEEAQALAGDQGVIEDTAANGDGRGPQRNGHGSQSVKAVELAETAG